MPQSQERTDGRNGTARDTETTTSSNQNEAVFTHEPGVYQDYRDGLIEDIAVHYVRINRVAEQKVTRNKQHDDNVRAAELDFMRDLDTLITETAADPDLELKCCNKNNFNQITNEYKSVVRKLTHRWGITLVDDRRIVTKTHTTLRRTQRPTFLTSRDVYRRSNVLVAEHAHRHRQKIKNLLSRPQCR